MKREPKRFRFTIQVQIATLIVALILILGVTLAWYNYSRTSEIIYGATNQLSSQIAERVIQQVNLTYGPVGNNLSILSLIGLERALNLEQRLTHIGTLHRALIDLPAMSGLQIGYEDGDYFILRPVTAYLRTRFSPPDNAFLMVDNIDYAGEQSVFSRLYFDEDYHLLSQTIEPYTGYDPRTRIWYQQAISQQDTVRTEPYLFFFMRQVGINIARALPGNTAVIAADVTLQQLSATIAGAQFTPSSEVVVVDPQGQVLAYPDSKRIILQSSDDQVSLSHITQLGSSALTWFDSVSKLAPGQIEFEQGKLQWTGSVRTLPSSSGLDLRMIVVAPNHELFSEAYTIRWELMQITILLILLAMPVAWILAKRIATPLNRLAEHARAISNMDFDPKTRVYSMIKEVDELSDATHMMSDTISRFLSLIDSLAREKNLEALQERILKETCEVAHADGALLYLLDADDAAMSPSTLYSHGLFQQHNLPDIEVHKERSPLTRALTNKRPSTITIDANEGSLPELATAMQASRLNMIALPLHDRQQQGFGLLCLLFIPIEGEDDSASRHQLNFVDALSGFAAVSLESKQLQLMQKRLLDSFIKLIAGAIDAKSPYTGGHCQRVPELTRMICEAAHHSDTPAFSNYHLSDEDWEALDIASWLHDCGKVTTPEYVVDKATKLETLYDRIHEVRMRFEVMKRDVQLDYWIAISEGGNPAELAAERDRELANLDEEFSFIARCNQGSEFMSEEDQQRLTRIARRTWLRTLDDRMGVSWEELQRKAARPPETLPVLERALDDKPEHLIPRREQDRISPDNRYGFKIDTPEHKYNRGELYNLCVAKGTLSEEERYMINDHIVQTIIMLEKLPYPRHLRDVPAIAGGHHEKMDGTGYPKKLGRDQLSISARAMAIADIFEALTAYDRPYKAPKTLSEALEIMERMVKDEHIDGELFRLFVANRIPERYAELFLEAEQRDLYPSG
ncbi:HD domain-containing phosphohydrolase [Aestuariirhabdus litorea]|uniref:HAMP domain-containing protein n=1 Tax=Aestuariirhabdus litorea TaxID=2528527 RepID=A0A3P3VP84_9GAMM|nr:HD domain-containing phosphohydrolase [Aestuariirhabdus litorea]RRJ84562.1 HAMP domain-containing protein [Aestuariirhabdus litorea]RWW97788.1 HAMP domain-containing protein [Endozoicomonadaceae bacterium GTF-13]